MASDDTVLRAVVIVVAAFLLVPLLVLLFAAPMMGGMDGGHMWTDGRSGGWAWIGSWLGMLLVVGVIGFVLVRALRSPTESPTDPAMEELRVAYARGDLTDEEFERRRERLQGSDADGET